jgi:hypothetical protein
MRAAQQRTPTGKCPSCGSPNYQTSLRPWCPDKFHAGPRMGVAASTEAPATHTEEGRKLPDNWHEGIGAPKLNDD